MSTRSATIIRQTTYWGEEAESEELMRFYRHCDGYPDGHGIDMAEAIVEADGMGIDTVEYLDKLKLAALSELRGHMESAIMDLEKEEQQ